MGMSINMMVRCLCALSICLSCLMMMNVSVARSSAILDEQFQHGFSNSGVDKVKLYLYYESLCPYSAQFIVNQLGPIFKNGLIDIVDLKLFPWGNAKLKSDNSFVCQHGANECLLNTIEACAIDAWPDLNTHFPFIYCVENLALKRKYFEWETCFGKLGLDSKPVKKCHSNGKGNQLELKYAAETDALEPSHQYVPWVTVDGQPLYEDYENVTSYVCKAYRGTPPSSCAGVSSANLLRMGSPRSHRVSYLDKAANLALFKKEANYATVM